MKSLFVAACAILFIPALVFAQAEVAPKEEHQSPEGHAMAVPELGEFHEVLHPLVHDAMPEKQYDVVRGKLDDLLARAKAVKKATLPPELKSVKKDYKASADKLVEQIKKLKKTSDNEKFEALFDEMHMTFEGLAGLTSK